jgi:signal transduction histidine kinase
MTTPGWPVFAFLINISFGILFVDRIAPLGVVSGLLHVAVIFLSLLARSRWLTLSIGVLSTGLVIGAVPLSPESSELGKLVANRTMTLLVLWSATGLSIAWIRSVEAPADARKTAALSDVGQSLNPEFGLDELAGELRTELSEHFQVDHLAVSIYQPDTNTFVHYTSSSEKFAAGSFEADDLQKLHDHLSAMAQASGQTSDLTSVENVVLATISEPLSGVIPGAIAVPLEHLDTRFGVLQFYSLSDDFNTPAAQKTTELIARQVSGTLYMARQFQEMTNLVQELRRSNTDLEQFAYITSHDLQEPLRKILAFSDRMQPSVMTLSEREQDYFTRISSSARRMQTLIKDLLALSKLTTSSKRFRQISLNDAVSEAIANLEISIERSDAKIRVEPLPSISADETQLIQLFQNLIGNAIKFRHPDRTPEVTIELHTSPENDSSPSAASNAQIDAKHIALSISDNGIGFENKLAFKIFDVFQRLKGRSEYEGNGIGLAFCKSIVDRHSGTIEVSSVPDVGTTFTVTLPKSQVNSDSGAHANDQDGEVAA